MERLWRWQVWAGLLMAGTLLPSCATDVRDTAWGAVLDVIAAAIGQAFTAVLPTIGLTT